MTQVSAQRDVTGEAIDLSGEKVDCACGVAFYVAIFSAIQNRRVLPGTVVLGDLTIQGDLKGLASIAEPLQVIADNGGRGCWCRFRTRGSSGRAGGDGGED